MEPFSITCTTCGAKLKVNDESLIGQILACPKCQAMVMVQTPENRLTVGRSDVDSQALTSESIQDELYRETNLHDSPPLDAALDQENASDSGSPDESQLPPADWQASTSKSYRQIGLIAVVAMIAIVSSVALFGLFVQSSINTEVAETIDEVAESLPSPIDPVETTAAEPVQPEVEIESNTDVGNASSVPTTPEQGAPVAEPAEVPGDEPPQPMTKGAESTDTERKFNDPGAAATAPEPSKAITELPEGLRGFADLFGPGLQLDNPPDKAEARGVVIRLEAPPKPSNRYPDPADTTDTEKRLAQPLGIDLRDASLHDAIMSLTGLTTLPITIDLESLDSAGVDLGKKTSVRLLDTTAEVALREILGEVGCYIEPTVAGHVAVRADEAAIRAFIASALSLADFDDASQVVRLVSQLSIDSNDPAEIEIDAGAGTIKINGSNSAIWRVALSLEALRLSRSLSPTLPAKFVRRWLSNDASQWEIPATGAISLEGDLERPVVEWIRQAASVQGSRILVDWPNAWQHGFTTETSGLPWTHQETLADLETELLSPFGLTIRDVGTGNWIVTTEFALAMSRRTIVFPNKLRQPNEILERLAVAMGYAETATFPAIIDPVTGKLIIRQTQFLLSQLPEILEEFAGK